MTTHETTGPEATDEQRFIAALWDDLKAVLDDATGDDTLPDQVRRAARQLARALIERLPAVPPVAVAAQVLRDLLAHVGGMTIHDEVGGSETTDKMIVDFAAERGIDLGEDD